MTAMKGYPEDQFGHRFGAAELDLQPSAGRQSAALPPSRSSGAIAVVASLSLTCFAIRDEACVAPCTNTIAIERARSSGSLGATSAGASLG